MNGCGFTWINSKEEQFSSEWFRNSNDARTWFSNVIREGEHQEMYNVTYRIVDNGKVVFSSVLKTYEIYEGFMAGTHNLKTK